MTVPPTSSTPEYAIRGWGLGLSQSRQDPMLFAVQNREPLGATPGFSAALKGRATPFRSAHSNRTAGAQRRGFSLLLADREQPRRRDA